MSISTRVVVPWAQARSSISELADHSHLLGRDCIQLLLIDDARKGLADVMAGRTQAADQALAAIQRRRADAAI